MINLKMRTNQKKRKKIRKVEIYWMNMKMMRIIKTPGILISKLKNRKK
jgi:hypothetical protein